MLSFFFWKYCAPFLGTRCFFELEGTFVQGRRAKTVTRLMMKTTSNQRSVTPPPLETAKKNIHHFAPN